MPSTAADNARSRGLDAASIAVYAALLVRPFTPPPAVPQAPSSTVSQGQGSSANS